MGQKGTRLRYTDSAVAKRAVPGTSGTNRKARRAAAKERREVVETVDGRIYFSDDGWETVWKRTPGTSHRVVVGKDEADRARFLAIHKYGGGRDD